MAKNKKIEKLLTELERMPMLRDYFNTIKDEIEKKYWEKGWNLPKIKNPRTKFKKVGKLRDLFLKIKIILKKMMHFDQTNIISQQITKKKKCIETTSFLCIGE